MSETSSPTVLCDNVDAAQEIATSEQVLDSIEERRRWPRAALPASVTLRAPTGAEVPSCPITNVSKGGLRVSVPIGFGLAVGQRYEVLLVRQGSATKPGGPFGKGHHGTVVRTEIMLGEQADSDWVGIGLEFETPALLQA
ncbi:MAG: PilZ domain-containing protein [Phycisphaerae bacterium]|nr:PilZ domain-containing protein [Phycisphaerae bacterium]